MRDRSLSTSSDARERILLATVELLLENGNLRVSMDDVAARSHSSKQTIYTLFRDKRDVFSQAISLLWDDFSEVTLEVDTQNGDLQGELEKAARQFLDHVLAPKRRRALQIWVETSRYLKSDAAPPANLVPDSVQQVVAGLVKRHIGNDAGRGLDGTHLAAAFFSLLMGFLLWPVLIDPAYAVAANEIDRQVKDAALLVCRAVDHG